MYQSLSDAPHHGVGGEHVEPAVLVDHGHRRRGHNAQWAGYNGSHDQNHDAVKFAKFMSSQHGECNNCRYAVYEYWGYEATHEHGEPGMNICLILI